MGGFFLLSQCAALAQTSSFWRNFSHIKSMELIKTKFAWFVRFQSLRLENKLENWLVTCKCLSFWNPDKVFHWLQEEGKMSLRSCTAWSAVTWPESDEMCDVMPATQRSERWHWEGSRANGAGLEKSRSREHGAVERLSRDLARQAVKRSAV